MSQYLNVYLRAGDRFFPIGDYCRSSYLFQAMNHLVPYGTLAPLTFDVLNKAKSELNETEKTLLNEHKSLDLKRNAVSSFNNSVEEKMDILEDLEFQENGINEDLKYCTSAIVIIEHFISVLEGVMYMDCSKDCSNCYTPEETCHRAIDYNKYLYAGVEAILPTLNELKAADNK